MMCGSAGSWTFSSRGAAQQQRHLIIAMTGQRRHRGSDDEGIWWDAELEEPAWNPGVSFERTRRIPNRVVPELLHPLDRRIARAELGIAGQLQLISVVARMDPAQNILDVLDCLPRLIQESPNLRIGLVGGVEQGASTYAEQVEARVHDVDLRGRVDLIGPLPQRLVVGWMHAADLLSLPRRREGRPTVAREALACGLPVLTTAVGAAPELLTDSQTGLVIPAHDQQALEAGLRRYLSEDWPERRGQETSEVRHWDQVAEDPEESCVPLHIRGTR